MGQVVIKFVGLCIHVHQKNFPTLPAKHRVILLSDPRRESILGKTVLPHVPVIYFSEPPKIEVPCLEATSDRSFRLNGVRLRIANGKNDFAQHETYKRSVPHITPPHQHLEAKEDVIVFGAAPAVAYFDSDHGILSACIATPKGAIGTSLTIDTGEEAPMLELSCFGTQTIQLANDAVLEIVNVAEHGHDDDNDYLLNYGIVKQPPADPQPPKPDLQNLSYCTILSRIGLDFGPPCSNSDYP